VLERDAGIVRHPRRHAARCDRRRHRQVVGRGVRVCLQRERGNSSGGVAPLTAPLGYGEHIAVPGQPVLPDLRATACAAVAAVATCTPWATARREEQKHEKSERDAIHFSSHSDNALGHGRPTGGLGTAGNEHVRHWITRSTYAANFAVSAASRGSLIQHRSRAEARVARYPRNSM
jgi:hypothetical protein